MAINDAHFQGDIPGTYERYMVPLLFDVYASDLAERIALYHPHRVLEVAAGSGSLTRAISARLPSAEIFATDLNQAMLDVAALRHPLGNVVWRRADASNLPFGDGTFDAVACQFGVMVFAEKEQAYRQMRRVLKPKGVLFFSIWDCLEANEFAKLSPTRPRGFFRATRRVSSSEHCTAISIPRQSTFTSRKQASERSR
jgi:ubiquinone/menaquinone biosynthesis C-methylase UbiE